MTANRTPRQRGQSMVEFLVVACIVTALLVTPWDGLSGDPVIVFLLKAIRTAFAKFLGAISVPV